MLLLSKVGYLQFMLINSPQCSDCLLSWYGLLIMVGSFAGVFSNPIVHHWNVASCKPVEFSCYVQSFLIIDSMYWQVIRVISSAIH